MNTRHILAVWVTALLMALALAAAAGPASAVVSTGDGSWFWQNPMPQGNQLSGVAFSDSQHGWAVGANGTIKIGRAHV